MGKLFTGFLLVIIASLFIFPFEIKGLAGVNTKMILACIGVILFLIQSAMDRHVRVDPGFIQIIILALLVSFVGIISVVYNHTTDYVYASYIISMLVWLFGAYSVVYCIRLVYDRIDIWLLSDYIIAVAVLQCVCALLIEYIPAFSDFVDSFSSGVGFQKGYGDVKGERLYGIGAFLDVAGMRFSCILCILSVVCFKAQLNSNNLKIIGYLVCFLLISCVGNMMSRTTIVGVIIVLAYWSYWLFRGDGKAIKIFKILLILVCVMIPLITYLYHTNDAFFNKFRFGFEGFFNYFEHGEWQTQSNDKLMNMFKLPDNVKTWLIGDGYFEDVWKDPYYIGYDWIYFYMGTDVGYSRFLYYFGIFGLFSFCAFFVKCTTYLMKIYPNFKMIFILVLAVNFIVWTKVASDCFTIFALYLSLVFLNPNQEEKSISSCFVAH